MKVWSSQPEADLTDDRLMKRWLCNRVNYLWTFYNAVPCTDFTSFHCPSLTSPLLRSTLGSQEVRYLNSTLKPLKDTQRICHSDT